MLLKNARVIPELTGNINETLVDVLLENDTIAAVSKSGGVPDDGKIVDLDGRTLLPGLIDMHVHLAISGRDLLVDNARTPEFRSYETYQNALATLRAGFTTVRDVGDVERSVIELKKAINQKRLTGPRLVCSGKILTPTEVGNEYFAGMYTEADSKEEVRRKCRLEFQAGADFIKVMASGAYSNPGGIPGMTIVYEDELMEMVLVARNRGSYVAAHAHGVDSILMSLKCGVRTIEHSSELNDECFEILKEGKSFIVPTLAPFWALRAEAPEFAKFISDKDAVDVNKTRRQRNAKYLKQIMEAGLKIGYGTDAGTTSNWHGKNAVEFRARCVDLGFSPLDVLRQATLDSAYIMGLSDQIGSIEAGKRADLVVIDGDPLKEIELMEKGVWMVVKDGEVVPHM